MTISGHGIVTIGRSIDEATFNAIYMERTAKIEHAARLMGFQGVGGEFKEMLATNRQKIQQRGRTLSRPGTGHSDEWRYYTRKDRARRALEPRLDVGELGPRTARGCRSAGRALLQELALTRPRDTPRRDKRCAGA